MWQIAFSFLYVYYKTKKSGFLLPNKFFCLLIFFTILFFQVSAINLTPYVINFDKNNYEASSKNWSIAQDSKGIIYIGNDEGLLQFDGSRWKLHKLPNEMVVRSVAIDSNDRIYTGSYEEFGYWEENTAGHLQYTSLSLDLKNFRFHNDEIWKIIIHKKDIYFQAFTSLFVNDGKNTKVLNTPEAIIFLLKANNRLFAQNINRGLIELVGNKFNFIPGSEVLSEANIKTCLPYRKDKFLLGSERNGLIIWDSKEFKIWKCEAQEAIKDKQINVGIFDGKFYYIGTITDGLFIIDKKGRVVNHFNTQNALQNNTVLDLHIDKTGNLWLALDKGVSCIKFNHPFHLVTDDKTKLGAVYTAALFNNKLYLGTNQGVYSHPFDENNRLLQLENFSIVKGSQGQTWNLSVIDEQLLCGHNNGTYRINNNQALPVSSVNGGYSFKKIITSDVEYLIQSTYTSLVLYKKDLLGRWFFSNSIGGFIEPARFIEPDHLDNIWVSHNQKGIYRIRLNKYLDSINSSQYFDSNNGFPSDFKIDVFNVDNRIVFTTRDKIYTFDDLNNRIVLFKNLNEKTGEFRSAFRIVYAGDHKYWFIKKNKARLMYINNDDIKSLISLRFTTPGSGMVENFENIVKLNNKLSLICLENGFALYDHQNSKSPDGTPQIVFREISYDNGKSPVSNLPLIQDNRSLSKIPFQNNHIKFYFSAMTPDREILYQYKLNGLENLWSPPSRSSEVEFHRLPWGIYSLNVKGVDEYGKVLNTSSYSFEIRPPWFATTTAMILYFLFGIGLITGLPIGIRIYLRRHKNKLITEQKRIIREKQKEERMLGEQQIMKLRNENLRVELAHKNNELANSTMAIIRKNESLLEIKTEIERQKTELGTRFPGKNYSKIIRLIDKNIGSEDDWKIFESHFDRANENFFKKLKSKFPDFTPGDLRLCAYLQLNLATKEIAPLLGISIRGVENHRYRLRKKMNLENETNLTEFLMSF